MESSNFDTCYSGQEIKPIVIGAFVALLVASWPKHAGAQAKQQLKTAATEGILSGKVFAITGEGDLKLARMADVYIMLIDGPTDKSADTVGLHYLEETNRLRESFNKDLEDHGAEWSEKLSCLKELTYTDLQSSRHYSGLLTIRSRDRSLPYKLMKKAYSPCIFRLGNTLLLLEAEQDSTKLTGQMAFLT